jgi:hypothetical protein
MYCKMAGAGFHSNVTFGSQICTLQLPRSDTGLKWLCGLWHSMDNLRPEPLGLWHSAGKFDRGVGIPQFIREW